MNTLDVEITIQPRNGRRKVPSAPPASAAPRIPRIARLMALAIKFQDMVDRGEVRDYADLARLGYVTRARITQIMNLLNLSPELQAVLLQATEKAETRHTERAIRQVVAQPFWLDQRRIWQVLEMDCAANGA